jgi:hypothetical protein
LALVLSAAAISLDNVSVRLLFLRFILPNKSSRGWICDDGRLHLYRRRRFCRYRCLYRPLCLLLPYDVFFISTFLSDYLGRKRDFHRLIDREELDAFLKFPDGNINTE